VDECKPLPPTATPGATATTATTAATMSPLPHACSTPIRPNITPTAARIPLNVHGRFTNPLHLDTRP